MKIRSKDKTKKLLRAYAFGLISKDDLLKLVDSQKVEMGEHLSWTLDQYSTIMELTNDIDIVKYILQIRGGKKNWLVRLFSSKNVVNMQAGKYLEILKFAKDGVEDIKKAISVIQQPEMSDEMKAAGFGRLNFGDLGIARLVGEYENIGTVSAYSLPMHVVIKSMTQLAALKCCEKRHSEIIENKSKIKK